MKTDNRLRVTRVDAEAALKTFAEDVGEGLTASPKWLLPKYFYDELGSVLFDAICLLPEYYPTRAEEAILTARADDIIAASQAGRGATGERNQTPPHRLKLLELGSGSAMKTRRIIEAVLRVQGSLEFTPVDISLSALEQSAHVLLGAYSDLTIDALAGDYFAALAYMGGCVPQKPEANRTRTLVLFLGSNIGNFATDEALAFLRRLRAGLCPGDLLLMGADLIKDARLLEAAYDDGLGITAAFNLNILRRINRELDADFEVRKFRHVAVYNYDSRCVEMYLESRERQVVEIKKLNRSIEFEAGERIHTESSHKYTAEIIREMGDQTGFKLVETWTDDNQLFSSNLLVAV